MRFLLPEGAKLARLFRFLALVAFFAGAGIAGGLFLFVIKPFWGSLGLILILLVLGFWMFFIFFLYGFLLLLAAIADYIGSKAHVRRMEGECDERG